MSPANTSRSRIGRGPVRNRRGEQIQPTVMTASRAKNEFGQVLDAVIQGGVVVVTRHAAARAVILSVEDYDALSAAATHDLETLSADFDAMLASLQSPKARAGMKRAYGASPDQLGKAAVKAARKRA